MTKTFLTVTALAGLALAQSASAAVGYSTDFYGYYGGGGFTVSGFDGWDTTNPDPGPGDTGVGQADYALSTNPGGTVDQQEAGAFGSLGGGSRLAGSNQTIQLFHASDVTTVPVLDPSYGYFVFRANFLVTDSTTSNHDNFGFSLNNATNSASIFNVDFRRNNTNPLLADVYLNGVDSLASIDYGLSYQLIVDINPGGGVNTYIIGNTTQQFYRDANGLGSLGIGNIAITQTTGATPGNGSISFDNIESIPEPSTVGLCVIAGLGGFAMVIRRRKMA